MGNLIAGVLLIILFVLGAAVAYAVFFAAWVPVIFILKIKRKWLATAIAIPLVGLVYIAAFMGYWQYNQRPSEAFKYVFKVPPPADVTNLKSDISVFGDFGEVYLQFECNRTTLDSLVASQGMSLVSEPGPTWSSDRPRWWVTGAVATWSECYEADLSGRDFGSEEAILIYHSQTRQVNYYWQGID